MNYFRTRQTDNIVAHLLPTGSFQYGNLGGLTIRGIQWESKYYFNSRMLAEGSLLYQTNEDAIGNSLHMPTPNLGGKAGLSYAERRGWTVGVFDVYTGLIPGYASTPNPKPSAHHLLTTPVLLNLEKYLGPGARNLALFAHGDNLANRPVWQPSWGFGSLSTLPVQRGRTIYFGLEVAFRQD